jgi:nucleoside phosphorylase
MIAVTFALPAESSAFLRRLGEKSRSNRSDVEVISGEINNRAVEIFYTGVGEKICRQRIGKFLAHRQPDCVISAGFAGALDDQFQVGDLLLAENFSSHRLIKEHSLVSSLPIHSAKLLTMPAMIDSAEERKKIAQITGASAVDMETEFIARACAQHGTPLLSLRVISDAPANPFPVSSTVLFDVVRQRTDMLKFAGFFLTHPNRLPHLVQFAKRITRARKNLATALVAVVRNIE